MLKQEEIKQILKIGNEYKYKELCYLLNETWTEATNKKTEQLENWERFFNYERIDKRTFKIKEIYDVPLKGFEDGFFYKTIIIPVKCSKDDYDYLLQCREWSGQCWNELVQADQQHYNTTGKYMTRSELQSYVKNITPLHASGNQYVFIKYFNARDAMFKSIQANHQNSDKVELPYKVKNSFVVGWNVFCFTIDYNSNKIYLSRKRIRNGLNRSPVCCSFKNIPKHVVEIELIHKKGLCLAIKYKEPKTNENIISDNVAAIDLGEIHSISSIDNNGNAIIITGRKIRDIKRFRNKEYGKIRSKRSHTENGSQQYNKYTNAIHKLEIKSKNQISDCVHKITKMYLDFCIENNISKVYYGDLDSCTRNTKGKRSKKVNQKLSQWCFGQLTEQLDNKLSRYGIEMIKVSEAYSSQTCPHCGHRYKPSGRNYECQCGYKQHRDLVGAMNILNFNEKDIHIEKYDNLKYLRID